MAEHAALVSVITPFYNAGPWLGECIESVLAQTHGRFEYLLVNNCSTDGSREVAASYAARDSRVRLVDQPRLLPQLENFNSALGHADRQSRYIKFVFADDALTPSCLEEMVRLADSDPLIGLVSSYWRAGDLINGRGVEWGREVWEGREIGRRHLAERIFLFGSPTTVMYRADLVRSRTPFFDLNAYHADTKVCYQILEHSRFGLVHQVLSYLRRQPESTSGRTMDLEPYGLAHYLMAMQFGPTFCSAPEWTEIRRRERRTYLGFLSVALLHRQRAFGQYHLRGLATIGERMSWGRRLRYLPAGLVDLAASLFVRVGRRLRHIAGLI